MSTVILKGNYGEAVVYTDILEDKAREQIVELLNQPFAKGANIRIMPDVHAGKGCVIGTTMRIGGKVCPNLVGVDIGCGVIVVSLPMLAKDIDLEHFDNVVNQTIPSGFDVRSEPILKEDQLEILSSLRMWDRLKNKERILASLGTLGGGNHFIELNEGDGGRAYLVIHSGSRNLGVQVATHYQNLAIANQKRKVEGAQAVVIEEMKAKGLQTAIPHAVNEIKKTYPTVPDHLAYLDGDHTDAYMDDVLVAQAWAGGNRTQMARIILKEAFGIDFRDVKSFQTVHNYIDVFGILRKGAVSARKGERFIVPINMRDGSIICIGKGEAAWNFSAPHGAGRLMSRGKARRSLTVKDFESSMQGIYSSTIGTATLDEAPMAYKPMDSILSSIRQTADVRTVIRPIYNFKSTGD